MSAVEQGSEEQWHVQVTKGDVRLWTIDQLDAAFKAELVDESTYVLEVGKTEWMQLGILLGLGEEEAAPPAAAPIAPVYAALAPEPFVPSVSPVTLGESPSIAPYSTAPIAADLDDLDSPAAFRSSKKGPKLIGAGVAVVLAAAAAFAFTHGTPAPDASAAAAAVAVAPPPPAPAPPPPAPAADTKPADDPAGSRLSGDQKEKLAALDKVHQARIAAQQKSRAAAVTHRKGKASKEKSPFRNGGDKYDPLNAKL
jgi:hypothetical protein